MITEQTNLTSPRPRGRELARLFLSAGVVAVILFFLGRVLYTNWEQLRQYEWRFNRPVLAASYIALVSSYLVDIAVWRFMVGRLGVHISFSCALRLWFAAGLAKYIPGTVWQFLGWFYLAQREGISKLVAGTSIILSQALSALAGALIALAAFAGRGGGMVSQLLLLVLILPIGLIVLQPQLVTHVLNWGLVRLKRQPITLNFSYRDLAAVFIFYLGSYTLWGMALFLFANALTPLPAAYFAPFLGVFPAAYALGLVAPFAPAGLGVREGTLTYFLTFFVPLPVATVIALLTRPWMMAVEIIGAAAALVSYTYQGKQEGEQK